MHDTDLVRDATREDIEGTRDQFSETLILWGTAGWDGAESVVDLGTATNGARNLARVTLYAGKPQGTPAKANVAQGHQVLVQLTGPVLALPPAGTQVQCSFPGGDINTPGNGTILNWALGDQKAPNVAVGDAVMYAPSGFGNFTRWRGDGRIEHSTHTDDGNDADVYALIDPRASNSPARNGRPGYPGFYRVAPWCTEILNETGYHLQTQWGAAVDVGGWSDGGVLAGLGFTSTVSFRASQVSLNSAAVKLGSGPLHFPVAIASGPTGIGITGLIPIVTEIQGVNAALLVFAGALTTGTPAQVVSAAATLATALTPLTTSLATLVTLFTATATPAPFESTTTFAI